MVRVDGWIRDNLDKLYNDLKGTKYVLSKEDKTKEGAI